MVYYPGFEVKDPNWFKFALLYIDQLRPIIPVFGEPYLSTLFMRVREKTDLIMPHQPDHDEAKAATLDAIDIVERIAPMDWGFGEMTSSLFYKAILFYNFVNFSTVTLILS